MKDPDELEAVAQEAQTAQTTATPEENAAAHEARSFVDSALEALPEEYRVVFVLRATAETAESLDLTPENVKVRLHRAKAMLKRELLARAGPGIASMYPFMGERCDRMVMNVMSRIRWNAQGIRDGERSYS
jgi:RNA polymerase sigma-70 factor (ECF subfamily)